jgi:hypothetical protein
MSDRVERRQGGNAKFWLRDGEGWGPGQFEGRDTGAPGYWVRIVYTEPEFQLRNPQCPPEFKIRLKYEGVRSASEALEKALTYFWYCKEHSHVGWERVIQSVTIEPA